MSQTLPAAQPPRRPPARPENQTVQRGDIYYLVYALILLAFVVMGGLESRHLQAEAWLDHENAVLASTEAAHVPGQGQDANHPFVGCGTGPLSMLRDEVRQNKKDPGVTIRILAARQGCGARWLAVRFVPTLPDDQN